MESSLIQIIGIDLSGNLLRVCRFDESGELLRAVEMIFPQPSMPGVVTLQICESVEEVDSNNQAVLVGLAFPATIDCSGRVVRNCLRFTGWKEVPLADWLEPRLKRKVTLANDRDCFLMAETCIRATGCQSGCLGAALLALNRLKGFSSISF